MNTECPEDVKANQSLEIKYTPNHHPYQISAHSSAMISSRNKLANLKDTNSLPKIRNTRQQLASQLRKISQYEPEQKRELPSKKYAEIYSWVKTEEIDYSNLRMEEVRKEHKKLLKALCEINQELEDYMKKNANKLNRKLEKSVIRYKTEQMNAKDSKVENSFSTIALSDKRKLIQDKEIHNNNFLLKMCRNEFKSLKKREDHLKSMESVDESTDSPYSANTSLLIKNLAAKSTIEASVEKTKMNILKVKKANQQLQIRNRILGDSIHNNDQFLDKMRKLEEDVESYLKRVQKLNSKIAQTKNGNSETLIKLQNIQKQFQIAEQYFRKINEKEKAQNDESTRQKDLKHKYHIKEVLTKKKEHTVVERQKQYHHLLKLLSEITENTKSHDERINERTKSNIILKEQAMELEVKLRRLQRINRKLFTKKGSLILNDVQLYTQIEKTMPIKLQQKKEKDEEALFPGQISSKKESNEKMKSNEPFEIESQISSIREEENGSAKKNAKQTDSVGLLIQSPENTEMKKIKKSTKKFFNSDDEIQENLSGGVSP